MAHDGIAGPWAQSLSTINALEGNTPKNMGLWPQWVRSFVIETDLLSGLCYTEFAPTKAGQKEPGIRAFHMSRGGSASNPTATAHKLMELTRPTVADFEKQLELVNNYADLRNDRAAEILTQVGFPTPFFASVAGLQADRNRHTLELIAIAQMLAAKVAMRVKHALACKRPDRFSPQIQPMIEMPGHGTLPSAHAAEAFIVATVLTRLMPPQAPVSAMLYRQACRIAVNRTVAGVHFPADTMAGAMIGVVLGDYLVMRAGGSIGDAGSAMKSATFDGRGVKGNDFFLWEFAEAGRSLAGNNPMRALIPNGATQQASATTNAGPTTVGKFVTFGVGDVPISKSDHSGPLTWLWDKARQEWDWDASGTAPA